MTTPATPPAGAGAPPAEPQVPPVTPTPTPTPGVPPTTPPAVPPAVPPTTPPAAKVVPENYDLKLPACSPLDDAHLERTAAYAKAQGLSQEEAQKLIDDDNKNFIEGQQGYLKKQSEAWLAETAADKEI